MTAISMVIRDKMYMAKKKIIRDKMGILIDGVFQICDATTSVLMGEFMPLSWAFQYASDNGIWDIVVESDSKLLIDCLNGNHELIEWNNFAIVEDILSIRNLCNIHSCG